MGSLCMTYMYITLAIPSKLVNYYAFIDKAKKIMGKFLIKTAAIAGVTSVIGSVGYVAGEAFLEDPYKNAINRKLSMPLFITKLNKDPAYSRRDTTINLNNNNVAFVRVNEVTEGDVILGGDFIDKANNSVRTAKDWMTTNDEEYGDDGRGFFGEKRKVKDIENFYGAENGQFKVGVASEFSPETLIVPNRFGKKIIENALVHKDKLRLLDGTGNVIYHNAHGSGKLLLYSPSTQRTTFISFSKPEIGVQQINDFLKINNGAQPIIIDNGRFRSYLVNPKGLTKQNFKNYYSVDESRKGNPGYNIVLKPKKQNENITLEDSYANHLLSKEGNSPETAHYLEGVNKIKADDIKKEIRGDKKKIKGE